MTKAYGTLHPTESAPMLPDTVTTFLMTGASSAQSADWLSSGSTAAANAGIAGVHLVRLTGVSTAGSIFPFSFNMKSTGAAVPTSGTSIASSGVTQVSIGNPQTFQIPGDSTGYSFAAFSSGYVVMEQWRK